MTYKTISSIQGIHVQGFGMSEVELAERMANLATVKQLEEQERARRIYVDHEAAMWEKRWRLTNGRAVIDAETSEQIRREMDTPGEERKKELASQVSAYIEAYWSLRPSEGLRASAEILAGAAATGKDILAHAGEKALEKTLSATGAILEKAHKLGDYAWRAASFFGWKAAEVGAVAVEKGQILGAKAAEKAAEVGAIAVEQGQILGAKAAEKAQILGEAAVEQGQILGAKAAETAQDLGAAAVEQGQILGSKAAELGEKAVAGAQALGEQLGAAAVEQAENIGELAHAASSKAAEKTGELIQSGKEALAEAADVSFALATGDFSAPTLSWKELTILEEKERQWRMKERLAVEHFLLAMDTSNLIKNLEGYKASETNRWYATAILEEFERKRRFLEDQKDTTALRNAHKIAYFILTHPRQKQTTSLWPAPAAALPAAAPSVAVWTATPTAAPIAPMTSTIAPAAPIATAMPTIVAPASTSNYPAGTVVTVSEPVIIKTGVTYIPPNQAPITGLAAR